jgi:MoaA/NifB/PqqE/SkfB family radical SAM enzyme
MAVNFLESMRKILKQYPTSISLEITTRCPLSCVYCHRRNSPDKDKDLKIEQYTHLKDKIKYFSNVIFLGIGEPLFNKHIYEYVNMLTNVRIIIVTSGTILIDYALFDRSDKLLFIFSIDSDKEEIIKKICGNYNYANFLKNIKEIHNHPSFQVFFNSTINEYNIDELTNIVNLAKINRIPALNVEIPVGFDEYLKNMKDNIRINLEKAKKDAGRLNIFFDNPYRLKCLLDNKVVPYIAINGDWYPCCEALYKNYSVGNIYDSEIDSLWENEKYNRFKTGILCSECSFVKNIELINGEVNV